jgi:hypothetical protein
VLWTSINGAPLDRQKGLFDWLERIVRRIEANSCTSFLDTWLSVAAPAFPDSQNISHKMHFQLVRHPLGLTVGLFAD